MLSTKVLAAVAAATHIAALLLGYYLGAQSVRSEWNETKLEAVETSQQGLLLGLNRSFELGLELNETKETIRVVTETIIKEIPVRVQTDPACPRLPDGWGVLHDAAAAGNAPGAAAR